MQNSETATGSRIGYADADYQRVRKRKATIQLHGLSASQIWVTGKLNLPEIRLAHYYRIEYNTIHPNAALEGALGSKE